MPEGEAIEEDPGEAMQVAQASLAVPASAATPGMSGAPTSQPAGLGAAVMGRSAFMPVGPTQAQAGFMPELQFLTQFPQLFSMHPLAAMAATQPENAGSGRTRTGDSKSTSAYASRHQAAEQRRRTRINERCVRLLLARRVVGRGTCCAGSLCYGAVPGLAGIVFCFVLLRKICPFGGREC